MSMGEIILCNTEDIRAEFLELGIDAFCQNDILKEIPVVNLMTSFFRVGSSIKDAFFYKKLTKFLYYMNEISSDERKKFYEKSIKDDKDFGDKLIYVLDTLMEK